MEGWILSALYVFCLSARHKSVVKKVAMQSVDLGPFAYLESYLNSKKCYEYEQRGL